MSEKHYRAWQNYMKDLIKRIKGNVKHPCPDCGKGMSVMKCETDIFYCDNCKEIFKKSKAKEMVIGNE